MIKTISMRIEPVRPPRAIATHRSGLSAPQALGLAAAAALAAVAVAAALFCPDFAHAADVAKTAPRAEAAATPAGAEEAMSAVRALPRFPDPYPAMAGVGP
jgi:hypothetical protein